MPTTPPYYLVTPCPTSDDYYKLKAAQNINDLKSSIALMHKMIKKAVKDGLNGHYCLYFIHNNINDLIIKQKIG
jgi:hypothetical protein